MPERLLSVVDLRRYFTSRRSWLGTTPPPVRAVDGVSFDVNFGETFSLVGESGCGKTTTARLVLRLDRATSGRILLEGKDLNALGRGELKEYRRSVQAVFQDPWSSLNPRMRAGDIIAEPLDISGGIDRRERSERIKRALTAVGLDPSLQRNFPHEFSGGMRQRIAVARALITAPKLIVLDEPVSALDVSIRAQIMNLLRDMQREFGVAYLLIAHNLATVRYLSHRVAAMYLGQIVEVGSSNQVLSSPRHPYTAALISASSARNPTARRKRIILEGEIPSPIRPPQGCRFHTRCWLYKALDAPEICRTVQPELRVVHGPDHRAACHFAEQVQDALDASPPTKPSTPSLQRRD